MFFSMQNASKKSVWFQKQLFRLEQYRFQRSPKFAFLVFVKKLRFLHVFFYAECIEKKVFGSSNSFLDQNNIDFKDPPNLYFSKGISPWFLSKIEIFPSLVFMQIASRKSVWLSSRKKMKTLKTIKTPIYKSPQKCIFEKGLALGFW